jgi:mono/diheme cytochrome c family protein
LIRRYAVVLLLTLNAGFGLAASSSRWERVPAKDHARVNPFAGKPEAVAAGALVFRNHCAECHKANAQGDGRKRPALRSDKVRTATDGDIEWFLRQGDLGHGMPSWSSLPDAQRWQVVAWLRSIQ